MTPSLKTAAERPGPDHMTAQRRPRLRGAAAMVLVALLAASCAPRIDTRGNKVDPDRLARIIPGQADRASVASLLGTPSSTSDFGKETWYYVTSRNKTVAFFKERAVSRQIVFISFAGDGKVDGIGALSEADGRPVTLIDRETPTAGQRITVLQQLIGNLGRFNRPSSP